MNHAGTEKLTTAQFGALLVLARLAPVMVGLPALGDVPAEDGWIGALVGTLLAVPPLVWLSFIGQKYPDKNIIEIAETLLGKVLGKILGVLLVWHWVMVAAGASRMLGEAYTVDIMTNTPLVVFAGTMMFIAAAAARRGIDTAARIAQLELLTVIAVVSFIILLVSDRIYIRNLMPVLQGGLGSVMKSAAVVVGLHTELSVLGMMIPRLTQPKGAFGATLKSTLASGTVMVLTIAALVSTYGPTVTGLSLPVYSMSRLISVGEFLERLEVAPLTVWTFIVGIKLIVYLWGIAVGIATVLGLPRYGSLVYPAAAICTAGAVWFWESSMDYAAYLTYEYYGIQSIAFTIIILFALSIGMLVRRRVGRPTDRR